MRRRAGLALIAFAAIAALAPLRAEPAFEAGAREDVVLLHGLGRSDRAMRAPADALARAGFRVHNLAYSSLAEEPEQLVADVPRQVDARCAHAQARGEAAGR